MSESNPGSNFAKDAYALAFMSCTPRNALNTIQQRLKKAKNFNQELADYFSARRELEEVYLKQLQKISKRNFLSDASSIPPGYAPVYNMLIQELAQVANIHSELDKRIAEECEVAIRNASSSSSWSRLREHDDSLTNTIREINTLETQLAKDQKKLEAASSKKAGQANAKLQETERALAQTFQVWETEAPFAFEAYQKVDAQRLELLKEVVAKFETAQSDAAQRRMQMAEKTMMQCLSFDSQADMQEFILKHGGAPSATRNGRSTLAPQRGLLASCSGTNGAGFAGEFGTSTPSIYSADRASAGPPEANTTRSTGNSTLKNALGRFGRSKANKDSAPTQSAFSDLTRPSTSASERQSSALSVASRPTDLQSIVQDAPASGDKVAPAENGLIIPLTPSPSTAPAARPQASSSLPPTSPTITNFAAPIVDSEGFSIPPPDRKPWETSDPASAPPPPPAAGAGGQASLLDDDAEEARETLADSAFPSRMTSMNINSRPITEDSVQDKAALERIKSTLLTSGPPQRRGTTRRDRRDVRNTTYSPMGMGIGEDSRLSQFGLPTSSSSATLSSPFTQSVFTGQPGVGEHRTQSMASLASTNPFENSATSAALRASLTERVNVIFIGREISKVMVVGEISIAARDLVVSSKPLHIRLGDFEQLEKAAPNPAFLKPVPDHPGEYLLDVKSLLEQTPSTPGLPANSGQAAILKYQIHVSDSRKAEYVPLNVHSQWRCESNQTSLLLNYSTNRSSRVTNSNASQPMMIQDLQFSVQVQPSTVTNVMTKPTGTWSAESKSMFWKLNEGLTLPLSEADQVPTQKLLARFHIEGQPSNPQPTFIKWKIVGKTMSSLDIQVLDHPGTLGAEAEGGLRIEEVVRQCVSGKYISSP